MDRVAAVRAFNRFYTRHIGVLSAGLLDTPYSLTEARLLFEIGARDVCETGELRRMLGLDAGYLSRILSRFEADGLITRERSAADARRQVIRLTETGRKARAMLDERSAGQIRNVLAPLSEEDQRRLVSAMGVIQEILGGARPARPYVIRPPRPGELGWVVHRHGVLYNREYGWDETFEALVAEIAAAFVRDYDPRRERCWIAEKDGENVGSVFLVKHPEQEGVAKLRLVLVKPHARGLGIGRRLVQECTRFALQAGYRKITLRTNSVLVAVRRIYEKEGYRLVHSEPHHSFGHDLVRETWELEL